MTRICESCGSQTDDLTTDQIDSFLYEWSTSGLTYDPWERLERVDVDETVTVTGLGRVTKVAENLENNEEEGGGYPVIWMVFKIGDTLYKKTGTGGSYSYMWRDGVTETHVATKTVEYYA